jgi:hypothetical protein
MATKRSQFFKTAGLVALGLIAPAYIANQAFENWEDSLCDTTVHSELPSPDSAMVLVVFDRDCGATTYFNTQVSLMPHNQNFTTRAYPSFLSIRGQHDLRPRWLSNSQVEITLPRGEEIYRRVSSTMGVAIKYNFTAAESAPSKE